MTSVPSNPARRAALRGVAALATWPLAGAALAQRQVAAPSRAWRVMQLLDTSPDQQELSRDYSTGVRLAFAEQARQGLRLPELVTREVDGSPGALEAALRDAKADANQVALVGTVGERLSVDAVTVSRRLGLDIAHLAPWLADTRFDGDQQVYPLFASRDMQIRHALQGLAATGVSALGLVYPTAEAQRRLHPVIAAGPAASALKLQAFTAPADGGALPANLPAVMLFLGGTVELALFSQGLAQRGLHRYVIGLADIDITTLRQLGTGRGVSLIFTQVVPNPQSSALPIVRQYRDALKAYFDEAPSPVSLAGYVAGRYSTQLLARAGAGASRAAVLTEAARRPELDLGGVAIDFSRNRRGSVYVNQILLQGDGRLIG
jgi:hypothetical protein